GLCLFSPTLQLSISSSRPDVRVLLWEEDRQQGTRRVRAGLTVGEGVLQLFQRSIPEEQLHKSKVREGRISLLYAVRLPPFYGDASALELEKETAAVEAYLHLARIASLHRRGKALFQGRADVAHEGQHVWHADIPGVGL